MMLFAVVFLCLGLIVDDVTSDSLAEVHKRILLNDNYDSIIAKLDALEKGVATLNAQTAKIDALEKEVATLKARSALSHEVVAFMAKLTKSVSGTGHHIYFDDVQLNLGQAYNPHHGIFVVPVNGTYLFSITACSDDPHYIVLQVNVNDSVLGKVLAGDTGYFECSSKVLLGHLYAGDDVYVQHLSDGDLLAANGVNGYPTFIGVLLQAD